MTGNLKLLISFVEKFMGTIRFGNDQFALILGYGDLVQGNVIIKRKSTCYVRDLKGNDLLIGSHGIDLYSITLQEITSPKLICLMAKASSSQAWLWHHRLSHLNFDTINLLSKNDIVTGLPKLKLHGRNDGIDMNLETSPHLRTTSAIQEVEREENC
ncbi:retrovirus-related pol polyprotein from transposon TNT 1-94 [Tanacetum coccineum]